MGLRARFSVIDDLGYPAQTPELGLPVDYSEGCDVFADAWLDAATDLVPVDTGHLQSTLDAEADDEGCTCETLCDYAQYVEYGTIKMEAQPYFEPALDIALEEATPIWEEAYEEALQQEQEELEEMEETMGEGGNRWQENNMIQSQMGGGGFAGSLLGIIIAAVVVGFFNILMDMLSPGGHGRDSSYHGGDGGGGGHIDVEII